MKTNLRKTGIDVLGEIPWGTHFCQFYKTKEDLLDLLVPYFKAGLENNEFCLWTTCDPLTVEIAFNALKQAVPGFDQHVERKSIQIIPSMEWYMRSGTFDGNLITKAWIDKLQDALKRGYVGMRVNGNETWLESSDWERFMQYEKELNTLLHNLPILVLCTYPLSSSGGEALLEVAHAHEWVVTRRKGRWEILEEPGIKKIKSELKKESDELKLLVAERTGALEKTVEELKKEINERKEAEDQLFKEKELSQTIKESFPGIFKIIDQNYRILAWNRMFEEFSGYDAQEIPLLVTIDDLHDISDRERALGLMQQGFINGTVSGDFRIRTKNGSIRQVFFIGQKINYEGKTCLLICGIDITKRKMAEDKLRQSENLLSEAEHLAHVGSWSLDLISKRVTWSDELYVIFGVQPSEFDHTMESVIGFSHPADKSFIIRVVEEAIKTCKPYDFHYRMIRPNGEERILHVRGTVMMDEQGRPARMNGAVQDVTERKKAEDELKHAYQRLSYHVENTPLAVIEWDKDLHITRWSGQAEKIFGWKASEVLGWNMYNPAFPIVYEEDRQNVNKIAYELIHGLVDRKQSLIRNYTKDGKLIYCEWYSSVLRDGNSKGLTILSLAHDVTERKRAEEKLSESYRQIRSLSDHLRSIREEERKYIAREIHDELGQYLTVLKMDVGVLNKKLNQTDDLVQRKLKGLSDNIDNAVHTVRRIASELRPTVLDELGLAAAIAWHLEEFEKSSGIHTHFTEPAEELQLPEPVKTNLFRILQESLTNVARHSNATDVNINLAPVNGHLTLTIADNGIGLAPDVLHQKKTMGILGMKERTAIIGGSYDIQSTPGNGTLITVKVPLYANPQKP